MLGPYNTVDPLTVVFTKQEYYVKYAHHNNQLSIFLQLQNL